MNKKRWYYLYITLLIVIFFVAVPLYYKHYGIVVRPPDPRDEKVRIELISEYERLRPLPGAVLVTSSRIIRNGSGVIAYGFSTELNDAEVLAYYDKQLKDNGWTYQNDEAVKYMKFNNHDKIVVYAKGEYFVKIGYGYQENERGKIRFTLSIDKPVK
jgi:hypothetical protein